MSLGDLVTGIVSGHPLAEAYGLNLGPGPQGGILGAMQGQQPQMAPAQATQSAPDMAKANQQLAQNPLVLAYLRQEDANNRANMFDKGAEGLVLARTPPSMQAGVMASMAPSQHDAGAMINQLMGLQYYQQMMNARPALIQMLSGGGGGGGGGLAGTAGGGDGGAAGGLGISPALLQSLPPDELMKLAEGQITRRAQAGIDIQKQNVEDRNKDLLEAQTQAPKQIQILKQADDTANQIKGAMESDGKGGTMPVLQAITSNPTKIAAANQIMTVPKDDPHWYETTAQILMQNYTLTPEERATLMQMKQLNMQLYGAAFEQTGSRRTGQEVKNLQNALSPLSNLNQKYQAYMEQYQQFQSQIHKSMGVNYGAAQELDAMPEQYRWDENGNPNIDQSYLPGGALYEGRGGEWVNHPPKKLSKDNPDGDFNNLQPNSLFIGPDGVVRRK